MRTITKQHDGSLQDTKKHIISSARVLFSEYSYLGVSMNDIAKELHISKAALYYHFTSKDEIYIIVLTDVFTDLSLSLTQALQEKSIDKKLHKLVQNYLDFGIKEKNLNKAIMLKLSPVDGQIMKHIAELRGKIAKQIQPLIVDVLQKNKISQKVGSLLLTSMLTSMMDGLLLEYSFLNKKIQSAKISDQIIAVLF